MGLTAGPSIVWLRDDLRVADNPALHAAAARREPIVVLYLRDEQSPEVRPKGAASHWWLHHSLRALELPVTLRTGAAREVLPALAAEVGAGAVFWNRRYGSAKDLDAALKETLHATTFHANLLFEPWTVHTGQGEPFKVFTPFWRAARELDARDPLPAPAGMRFLEPGSERLEDWELVPEHPDWAAGLRDAWTPGETAAHDRLERFIERDLEHYDQRDFPGRNVTSRLSPRLAFGELSPFQIWHRVHGKVPPAAKQNVATFLRELGWREFNHHTLFHHQDLATVNLRREFDAFEWNGAEHLPGWQQGRTGVPLVDAGMRELWHTGYMHNRVRMVAASLLIKNLLIDWRLGERWFWDTLVDADEANNAANWQWVAGSGADAAPYFRIFNPALQASKFDPAGEYIRRWVPELGTDAYPAPIFDLAASRREALARYARIRG